MRIDSSRPTTANAANRPSQGISKDSRLSENFRTWLHANGYGHHAFAKGELPAFGGRSQEGEAINRQPVIFIHGNGATAADYDRSVEHFESKGYQRSELYGYTWGTGSIFDVAKSTHSEETVSELRAFIEAVKGYTGAEQVDVISHSMGVTLARKAIQGGPGRDREGSYDLGAPLTGAVDTFVGIAGANQGLSASLLFPTIPTSNSIDGFFPGLPSPFGGVMGQSAYLRDLNATAHDEGQHVFSIWSPQDEVVNGPFLRGGGRVYGVPTSRIPGQDGELVLEDHKHNQLRTDTVEAQHDLVTKHEL